MVPTYFKDKFVPIISYSNTSPKILKNRRVLHELFLPRYDSYILPMVKSLREVWSLDNENLLIFFAKDSKYREPVHKLEIQLQDTYWQNEK
jgi:hypothetical protein